MKVRNLRILRTSHVWEVLYSSLRHRAERPRSKRLMILMLSASACPTEPYLCKQLIARIQILTSRKKMRQKYTSAIRSGGIKGPLSIADQLSFVPTDNFYFHKKKQKILLSAKISRISIQWENKRELQWSKSKQMHSLSDTEDLANQKNRLHTDTEDTESIIISLTSTTAVIADMANPKSNFTQTMMTGSSPKYRSWQQTVFK